MLAIATSKTAARAIQERANHIFSVLSESGTFIASGITKEQSITTKSELEIAGFNNIVENPREDWVTLICKR